MPLYLNNLTPMADPIRPVRSTHQNSLDTNFYYY
jgi:hypothetical protein